MTSVSRRDFLKLAGALASSLGLIKYTPTYGMASGDDSGAFTDGKLSTAVNSADHIIGLVANGLEELATGKVPLVWLHGLSCSGCSVSFLNTSYPDPAYVLTQYISLDFHSVISAASGDVALKALNQRLSAGDYALVVEGAVPQGMPAACRVGEETFQDLLLRAAKGATAILALGTCAAFGGIPGAPSNPTGAVSVTSYLKAQQISKPIINVPGCPPHPDWLTGTLVHLLKLGLPELNEEGSPMMFYRDVIHIHCPEFYDYNIGKFAKIFGDEGCLFELGCLGIRTYADCASRRWNSKVNWCVGAGAPCIGCTQSQFALDKNFPFYRIREQGDGV